MTSSVETKKRPRVNAIQALLASVDRPRAAMSYALENARSWWLPGLLCILALIILSFISGPINARLASEQLQAQLSRLSLSSEQLRAMGDLRAAPSVSRTILMTVVGGIVGLAIRWVAWAGLLHFNSLALEGESNFSSTFSMVVWSWLPLAVGNLIKAGYVGLTGEAVLNEGLSLLVASGDTLVDSMNIWWVLLSSITPCLVWHMVLLVVGFRVASGFSRTKSAVVVAVWWLFSRGLVIAPIMLGRGLMSRFVAG